MSVPNQYAADGGRRRLIGETASGSIVASHGARSATRIMPARIAPPTSAIGWRRNASRKRRQVGDTDLPAAIGEAGRAVATSVGKGRPDRLTSPPGGSERSERGGMFIPVGKGRPDRLTSPPGGSERSERGEMFHRRSIARRESPLEPV